MPDLFLWAYPNASARHGARFCHFFTPLKYRDSGILLRQVSCHFSLPIILSAPQLGQRAVIPPVSAEIKIFLRTLDDKNGSRNLTYRDHFSRVVTSNTVLRLNGHVAALLHPFSSKIGQFDGGAVHA